MAIRRRRRRKPSGVGWMLPTVAVLVVLAGLSGLGFFIYTLERGIDYDPLTNCRIGQELQTTVIFIDNTTPFTQTQFLRMRNIISEEANVPPYEHQIILTSVREALDNSLMNLGCLPVDPSGDNFDDLTQNRTLVQAQRQEFFQRLENWLEDTASIGSYQEYLERWASQFRRVGVSVQTTDTEIFLIISDAITFESGADNLSSNGRDVISEIVDSLLSSRGFSITVVGHTDNIGDSAENLNLSNRRAANVVNELIASGIPRDSVRADGRGESDPLATNATEDGRAANRRVEIILVPTRPLIEALDRSFVLIRRNLRMNSHVNFVMFSDMAQASPTYSVYSEISWEEFMSSSRGANISLSDENVSMSIFRIPREETISRRDLALRFWRRYFDERNIRVVLDSEI